MTARVLVAGIGNVFLGDDGFGVEVARRLAREPLPDGVAVADYGIRGMHLAYELLDGRVDTLIMVDAVPLGEPPGTVAVLEADLEGDQRLAGPADAHGMTPTAVLGLLHTLGGSVDRVLVVGCEPSAAEERMELSEPVRTAVAEAVRLTLELATNCATGEPRWTPSSC